MNREELIHVAVCQWLLVLATVVSSAFFGWNAACGRRCLCSNTKLAGGDEPSRQRCDEATRGADAAARDGVSEDSGNVHAAGADGRMVFRLGVAGDDLRDHCCRRECVSVADF